MAISYINHGLGLDTIPNYVSARSEFALRRAMFLNNLKHKGFVVYQDIQWVESKKKWFAWYYVATDAREFQAAKVGE